MNEPLITIGAGIDDVEDGTYDLTCTGVEAKVLPGTVHPIYNPEGKDKPVFIWKFVFTGTEQEIQGVTSQMTGPQSKSAGFIAALLGPQALLPGATYSQADFVGKRALGKTEHNAKGYPRVVDLIALPKGGAIPAQAPAAPAPVHVTENPAAVQAAVEAQAKGPSIRAQAGEAEVDDLPF